MKIKQLNVTKEQVEEMLQKAINLKDELESLNQVDDWDSESLSYAHMRAGQMVIRLKECLVYDYCVEMNVI